MTNQDQENKVIAPIVFLFTLLISTSTAAAESIDFERDIAPILEENCWGCHSENEPESSLTLTTRAGMLTGGDTGLPAVIIGNAEKSYLIEVVEHIAPEMAMPPEGDKLPDEQIQLLRRWIDQGAVWPGQMEAKAAPTTEHWSFQPVIRPGIPNTTSDTPNPIDRFLLRKLEQQGLSYSESATPVTLIRRASVVLTGLQPTYKEVKEFKQDYEDSPAEAYATLIDNLLASPHFGERWGQHWLDVIRWAETNGSEANLYRKNAWMYRDYVVRAFNDDLPYDQFVREQIAGDSLGAGEATGFLVAGPHVPAATVGREPAAVRQARADRMDEIMQTVGASVLGLTIGCARCHNHKFDPVTIRDYYAMTGVFQDIEFGSRFPEYNETHPRRVRGEAIMAEIQNARDQLIDTGPWIENWGAYKEIHFRPLTTKSLRIKFQSKSVGFDEIEIYGTESENNLALADSGVRLSGFQELGTDNRNPMFRVNDGEYGTMAWRSKTPPDSDQRPWIQFDFPQKYSVNRVQLSSNREYFYETDYLTQMPGFAFKEFQIEYLTAQGEWKPAAGSWWIENELNKKAPDRSTSIKKIQDLISELALEGPQPGFVGRFIKPKPTRILLRGSPESPRDEVTPAGPAILQGDLGLNGGSLGSERRLQFAKWITNADNPLTARVMANRIWHHTFGAGLVSTTSDFGKAGALPTHPELLDWLAAEFVNPQTNVDNPKTKPWSTKHLIRLIVMSDAFRQSSSPKLDALAKDGSSSSLWRFPPKRVEAEVIRDSILQASSVLDRRVGGQSYRIHNVKKTYAQWQVLDNYGPQTWRRMLYQERMRRVDDGMFTAFDFPDCGQVRAKRPISTTPLQALNLMNSQFVIEQSKLIAERANAEVGDVNSDAAIQKCFEYLLSRQPDQIELHACQEVCRASGLEFVCRALINSNEFAFLQ